jgi:hypothetical protein
MKIGCLISQFTLPDNYIEVLNKIGPSRYDGLTKCAIDSFKKFHPDIEVHHITNDNFPEYYEQYFKSFELNNYVGIVRFMLAYELMVDLKYDKMILLGCDTITCSRLDEFIDNNKDEILASLNYPCQESTEYVTTPVFEIFPGVYDHGNINADVVCFNNSEALKKVIELSIEHFSYFGEQGALNELAWVDKSHSVKVVDFPYPTSNVVYNARSKGVFGTNMIKKGVLAKHGPLDGQPSPIKHWYVKDKKLYTHDHKQIKCFHYVEGLAGRSLEEFNEIIDDFKYHWFNSDTINFFKEKCGCSEFFN